MLITDASPIPIKKDFMLVISGSNPSAHDMANIILPISITNKIP